MAPALWIVTATMILTACGNPLPDSGGEPSSSSIDQTRGAIVVSLVTESGEKFSELPRTSEYSCASVRKYISGPNSFSQEDAPPINPAAPTPLSLPPGVFSIAVFCGHPSEDGLPQYEGTTEEITVISGEDAPAEAEMKVRSDVPTKP